MVTMTKSQHGEQDTELRGTSAPLPAAASRLVARADAEILAAQLSTSPADTFLHAHFAALRAAGAVLEASGRARPRGRARNAWDLLSQFVPEFASWAGYFADGARLRSAVEAGRGDDVSAERAEAALAAAEDFRDVVAAHLGLVDGAGAGSPWRPTAWHAGRAS
ncbi:hypothetical protein SAMN04488035_0947 [Flavimobilis marinus]|uniref:SAV-6107-like HEPN domain-containing protein n=1 Tax=Flavimobilis marinus TaxID=285351 RepID=A0A1I2EAI0_9MICO|nr:SAV_6107 family HEPN domain-containing protein [Flavimobilis marinus]SFE89250.1 hypothetical protein SAMN04488035_0947 [Flavimobilis marinus]